MIGMLAWTRPAQKKAADQEITVAEITQGLRRAATGAAADGNWSAVVQATMGLARLGGLLVGKRHVQLDDQVAHL